tara:strand:- start:2159 stop:2995 length:837 start_codon:yes stop_codon:yes gene_type:complete
MDIHKLYNKTLTLFNSFIKDLIITLPEYSEILTNNYNNILELETLEDIKKYPKLDNFMDIVYKYNTYITKRDRKIFDKDIELLEGISSKVLWNKEITPKNRNIIWKYLQSFCIISMNLKSSKDLQNLINGEEENVLENKKDLKDLKKMNQLTKDIKQQKMGQGAECFEGGLGEGLENILESSSIGKLAKEIACGLDIGDMNINPNGEEMDMSKMLQSTDFLGLFNKINEQVKEKFETGEINEDILSSDAENLMPNLLENPFFKNMMNSDLFKGGVNNK